jgi:hypothetical protein
MEEGIKRKIKERIKLQKQYGDFLGIIFDKEAWEFAGGKEEERIKLLEEMLEETGSPLLKEILDK